MRIFDRKQPCDVQLIKSVVRSRNQTAESQFRLARSGVLSVVGGLIAWMR